MPTSKSVRSCAGFTLAEIMIVVAIIGLLSAIAVPNFAKARRSARVKACIGNLKAIEAAKHLWAFENHKVGTVVPTPSDITPYLSDKRMPLCPGGGTYRIKRIDKNPSCSLWATGHTLSNLNLDEDADPD